MSGKTTRLLAVVAAASSLAIALAGCAGGPGAPSSTARSASGKPLVYIVPSSWANYAGLKQNIDAYTAKTGVKVEVQGVPDEQYDQNVRAKLATGGSVDIFAGLNDEKDPGSFMRETTDPAFKARMTDTVYRSMLSSDGKLYGVPTADGLSTFGVFYNKDVFSAAGITQTPKTLDEFAAALKAVKAKEKTPLFLAGKDGWTLLQHRNSVDADFVADNADIATQLATNKATWSQTAGFTQQYQALADWSKNGLVNSDFLTASYEQSTKAVAEGKAGAIINGSWVIGELRDTSKDGKFGFFALPNPTGKTAVALSRPNMMHIAKDSAQPDQARALLEFLIQPAQVSNYLASTPGIPAFIDVTIANPDPILTDVQSYVDAGAAVAHFDNLTSFPTPQDDLIAAYQELVAGRIDVAAFGKRYDAAWQTAGKTAGIEGF